MDTLRKLVLATATMSMDELRNARKMAQNFNAPYEVKEVVLRLIDLFIATGVDPERRARSAAACLLAIDKAESAIGNNNASHTKPASTSGGWAGWLVIAVIVVAIWFFSR